MPLPIREKHIKINVHFPKMSQLILFDNIHDNKRPNTKALHKKKKKRKKAKCIPEKLDKVMR